MGRGKKVGRILAPAIHVEWKAQGCEWEGITKDRCKGGQAPKRDASREVGCLCSTEQRVREHQLRALPNRNVERAERNKARDSNEES
jgi:hypothetical protein